MAVTGASQSPPSVRWPGDWHTFVLRVIIARQLKLDRTVLFIKFKYICKGILLAVKLFPMYPSLTLVEENAEDAD